MQPEKDHWLPVWAACDSLSAVTAELARDRSSTVDQLEVALEGAGNRGRVLFLLGCLDTSITGDLTRTLTRIALSHGYALHARRLLGRLSHREASQRVPPAVWEQLEETDDDDAYRRMAELLQFLGLAEALEELCRRAAAHVDPHVREVAEDFPGREST
jgi:hypothetical protein